MVLIQGLIKLVAPIAPLKMRGPSQWGHPQRVGAPHIQLVRAKNHIFGPEPHSWQHSTIGTMFSLRRRRNDACLMDCMPPSLPLTLLLSN